MSRVRVNLFDVLIVTVGLASVTLTLSLAAIWPGADPGNGAGPAASAAAWSEKAAAGHLARCERCRAANETVRSLARASRGLPCKATTMTTTTQELDR